MKSILVTLLMGLIALVASSFAWYFYPKIQVEEVADREFLVAENQAFDSSSVRRFKIETYDKRNARQIELVLNRGRWEIPARNNFLAGNAERIAAAINAMSDKKILELVSDQQDDHETYGVLEYSEAGPTGLGLGSMVTLEGRNRQTLGKMIVGNPTTANPAHRYVRLPGQPQIYIVDFNDTILTTEFADWTDGDLLGFGPQPPNMTQLIDHIEIDFYFIDPETIGSDGPRKQVYRTRITFGEEGWVYDMWQPAEGSSEMPEEPSIKGGKVDARAEGALGRFVRQMLLFALKDVTKKPQEVARELNNPNEQGSDNQFEPLHKFGYRGAGFEFGQHQFESTAGVATIALRNGQQMKMHIGNLASMDVAGGGNINRFMMITADFDESLMPLPPNPDDEPADDEAESESEGEEAAESGQQEQQEMSLDDRRREYQARLNQRNQIGETARQRVRAQNQIHADWIYVIPEDAIEVLFPPADSWKAPPPSGNHP
ncbi:MAG: DUF4340 domain-containing protein [Pirellulaceae bacterium]